MKGTVVSGKYFNGTPIMAMSSEFLETNLGFPKTKRKSNTISVVSQNFVIDHPAIHAEISAVSLTKRAALESAVAPYLRAIVAVFFAENKAALKVMHPMENRLSQTELVGVLEIAYEHLTDAAAEDEFVQIVEENATHAISGSVFSDILLVHLDPKHYTESIIVDVYHDYLHIFHNLQTPQPILQVIRGIKEENVK